MKKVLEMLGLPETATEEQACAAIQSREKGLVLSTRVRTAKTICKHAGQQYEDWNDLDSEGVSERLVEIGINAKGQKAKAGKPAGDDDHEPPKKQAKPGDDDPDKAAIKAEREALARQVMDNHLSFELRRLDVVNADMLPYVIGAVKRDAVQVSKNGEIVTGVVIPDAELQRLRTEIPSAFKQVKEPGSPGAKAGGAGGDNKTEAEQLAASLATRAADSVMGRLPATK